MEVWIILIIIVALIYHFTKQTKRRNRMDEALEMTKQAYVKKYASNVGTAGYKAKTDSTEVSKLEAEWTEARKNK